MEQFKIRASACIDIMANIGLTDKQFEILKTYTDRHKGIGKPLTELMEAERVKLSNSHTFPELSDGAKTYCKKWLKEYLYGRRKQLKNKYVSKGNSTEENGFDLMATELVNDMVYKNTERNQNEWATGECDLFHKGIVYDNKSSWDLDTFPMFETELTDKKYWWQMQVYMWLWNAEKSKLCYTLNDAPDDMIEQSVKWIDNHDERYKIVEQMIYTKENFNRLKTAYFPLSTFNTFVEIPDEKRIKSFDVEVETECRAKIETHVKLCRTYINSLLKNK